jgi:hypothetical protein
MRARASEQGGVILVAMVVLSTLSILAGLTVMSTESGLATMKTQRFHTIAEYAAESGAAAAMVFLRDKYDVDGTGAGPKYSAQISANNLNPPSPPGIAGNNLGVGVAGNPFSNDMQAHYRVMLLNNRADPGFSAGVDSDGIIQIYVNGFGPDGSIASMVWEIQGTGTVGVGAPLTLVGWSQVL